MIFVPAPGRAPALRLLARQTRFEIQLTVRRGEALVLSLAVPVMAMLAAGLTDVVRLPTTDRLGYVAPGAIALTVMSTAFVGQAITVGYERFYGVLKRLGASSLTRTGLLAGKTAAVLALVLAQSVLLAAAGVAAGWRPDLGQVPAALAVTVLATAAYGGLALALASLLRPETTTAAATLLYVLMLAGGGAVFPSPGGLLPAIPVAAHAEALRATLTAGTPVPLAAWLSLGAWAVVGLVTAVRTFRWE